MSTTVRDVWPLPETALKPALALVLAIEHAPIGVLMLRNQPTDDLEPVVAEGMTDEQWSRFGPTIRDVMKNGHNGHNGHPSLRDVARTIGFRGLEVVPLVLDDGTTIGAMAALFRVSHRPSARSCRLAEHCGRLVAIALDNARLRVEAEHRREMVEGMARARVQYVAKMGHELRTPLQSITGYIDLLRLGTPDSLTPRQAQMLERVRESERILIHAIDDLGTMARLEAGRLDYLIVAAVAGHAVAQSVAVIEPLAAQKRLAVDMNAPPQLLCMADEMKLKQILVNLLANAVKFTPFGGKIHVTVQDDGRAIVFEVSDTGPGIPEEKLHAVFEPYVQLNSTVSGLAGSGLGLAISQEFAHGMKGSLTVSSVPGNGSTFRLRLPRA